ncbi:MAG: hypothetical protein IJJ74_08560 [Eubacterium sp.]|nr:hypothetical protein [Eubacterium sp.]
MKRHLLVLLLMMFVLTGCSASDTDKEKNTGETATGHNGSVVEAEYIYVDGHVYINALKTIDKDSIKEDIIKLGEVTKQDDSHIPDEEFESTHIPVGTAIYRIGDNICIYRGGDYYILFEQTLDNGMAIDETEDPSTQE